MATPQTATGFSAIKAASDSPSMVRKALEVITFLAPMNAELPPTITDQNGALKSLPEGWLPAGVITPDGLTFGGDVEKQEVEALGYATPVRTDVTKAPKTISVTFLESYRRPLMELIYGMDLSEVTQGANGELVFDELPIPQAIEYRLLTIARDGAGNAMWIDGRGYGRVKLASIPEETWTSDNPMQYPVEFDVLIDENLGTPVRHYIGGPGAKNASTKMGFALAEATGPIPTAPTISDVDPTTGPAAGGTSVTLMGTGFVSGATVKFGDVDAANVAIDSANIMTVVAPAGTGSVDITVTTPGGVAKAAEQFVYTP